MTPEPSTYPGHRCPAEVVAHAVWLCRVFGLSLHGVELIPAGRGVAATHESVRRRGLKSGPEFAGRLRRRRPRPGDTRHLDQVFIRVSGVRHHLWRAIDRRGVVLDILVQERRDGAAAKRSFGRLLRGSGHGPRRLAADGLRSCGPARRWVPPAVRHRTSRCLDNRAEDSRRATRRRNRQRRRSKPPALGRRFLSAHGVICGHFRPRRHLTTAGGCRRAHAMAFSVLGRDYLGCRAARNRGGCRNARRARRAALEARVLEALGARLMRPELVAEFCAAFVTEWNRLAAEASAGAEARARELRGVERKIENLIDAVAGGLKAPGVRKRLEALEARRGAASCRRGSMGGPRPHRRCAPTSPASTPSASRGCAAASRRRTARRCSRQPGRWSTGWSSRPGPTRTASPRSSSSGSSWRCCGPAGR